MFRGGSEREREREREKRRGSDIAGGCEQSQALEVDLKAQQVEPHSCRDAIIRTGSAKAILPFFPVPGASREDPAENKDSRL